MGECQPPVVVAVIPDSPADLAGLVVGDELVSVNGQAIRDVIQWRVLTDEPEVHLEVARGGLETEIELTKAAGAPLGIEVDAAVFDRVRTCDNHCEFCFIHQLPPGMRRSLSLRDDDYRLSFLYGNFTTLTRFTEADLERVITEGLSPLYVSIHATDPHARTEMLRNPRGATSLRWLRALLDAGVEVHGQIVVCPGVNDGEILEDTLAGVLEEYPQLADVALVPLGVSKYNKEARMRPHTIAEARAVVSSAERWAEVARTVLGRRMIHVADEYYLLAGLPFPSPDAYEGFGMHEDGIGMARAFEAELVGATDEAIGVQPGFFSWVDGAPATGYRAPPMGGRRRFSRRWGSGQRLRYRRIRFAGERSACPRSTSRTFRNAGGPWGLPPDASQRQQPGRGVDRAARCPGARTTAGTIGSQRRSSSGGREPLLRRQCGGHRPHGGRGPHPHLERRTGRPPLPVAGCLPVSGALPRWPDR